MPRDAPLGNKSTCCKTRVRTLTRATSIQIYMVRRAMYCNTAYGYTSLVTPSLCAFTWIMRRICGCEFGILGSIIYMMRSDHDQHDGLASGSETETA